MVRSVAGVVEGVADAAGCATGSLRSFLAAPLQEVVEEVRERY